MTTGNHDTTAARGAGRVRIGTRGSALALWQARWLQTEIERRRPDISVELVVIRTESDRRPDVPITAMESRGVFTRDIEQALLDGEVDAAVHSLKDLPSEDAPGLVLAATSPREDPRDALLTPDGVSLEELKSGAVVGTSSLRRAALLRAARPDLNVRPIRGNIDTRLAKLRSGAYDAIVMAAAALNRLGRDVPSRLLEPETWTPAVAQGIIGVQVRANDVEMLSLLSPIGDPRSGMCARIEREMLHSLGGGCSVPVGGLARLEDGRVTLRGFVGSADGRRTLYAERSADEVQSHGLGALVAADLRAAGAEEILAALRSDSPLLRSPDAYGPASDASAPAAPPAAAPLAGKCILTTRAAEQASELSRLIELQGGTPVEFPTIRIQPPSDWAPVDGAIRDVAEFQWLVFTSANGVRAWFDRAAKLGLEATGGGAVRTAAVGPATARELEGRGATVSLVPAEYVAESLLDALLALGVEGVRFLLPQAAQARRTLADGLRAAGAIVHTASVYTTEPSREDAQELREVLRSGALDAATFTSASTVRNLVAALAPESAAQLLSGTVVACIGPITAATAREHGVRVDVEASEHTLHGLVAALAARLKPVGDAGPNPAQDDGRTPTTGADSSGGRTAS